MVQAMVVQFIRVRVVLVQVETIQVVRAQVVEIVVGVEAPKKVEATPEVVAALLLTTSDVIYN